MISGFFFLKKERTFLLGTSKKRKKEKKRTSTRSTREPSTPAGRRSASTMWLSVPPETSVWPRFFRPGEEVE
jgi:hypothetical protein